MLDTECSNYVILIALAPVMQKDADRETAISAQTAEKFLLRCCGRDGFRRNCLLLMCYLFGDFSIM